MNQPILGLHHVTAMCGEPQANVDFYAGLLGLRMIKVTVNFDDPGTYHLYYGDGQGSPGSAMTFFPWPGARRGVIGAGQVGATAFSVPAGSIEYWRKRLTERGLAFEESTRFGELVLAFTDPDGLGIELIGGPEDPREPWSGGEVPAEHAPRGFHSVSMLVRDARPSALMLGEAMEWRELGREGNRIRFVTESGLPGQIADIIEDPGLRTGLGGVGTVHHVAWRVADDDAQEAWRQALAAAGAGVTPVRDRNYFHSIYFREPGGVLYEIATDGPGFAIDERAENLGEKLMLPPWYEPERGKIERMLAPFVTPGGVRFP